MNMLCYTQAHGKSSKKLHFSEKRSLDEKYRGSYLLRTLIIIDINIY